MSTHREIAEFNLREVETMDPLEAAGVRACYATAHAVLALLDYLQQDDEEAEATAADVNRMSVESVQIKALERQRDALAERVRHLAADLETTRATLRAHEAAVGDSMRQRKIEDAGQL